jgi:O-antigen/teichoic acid export membrane protein
LNVLVVNCVVKVRKINKGFIKDTIIYVFSSGLSRILLIILIPLYTKYLSVEEFGQYDLSLSIISILSIIFSFGLPQALQLEFFDIKAHNTLINKIFSTHLFLSLLIIPLLLIVFYMLDIIPHASTNAAYRIILELIIIAQSYITFQQISFLNILKLNQETKYYFKLSLIIVIVQGALSLIVLLYVEHKVIYLLLSNFLGVCLTIILCARKVDITIAKKYLDLKTLFEKSKLGFILVLGYFSYWVINGADRWIVLKILGDHQLGVYSIAARLSSVVEPMLLTPVLAAYLPFSFKKYANRNYDEAIFPISTGVITFFIIFAVASYNLLPYVLSSKMPKEVYKLMPYFIMGYSFYFIAQISVNLLVYKKFFKILLKNIVIVAIVNILLNVFLLKTIGLIGSAFAFLAANILWMLLSLYERRRVVKKLKLQAYL